MFEKLEQADRNLFLLLNGHHSPFFDGLMWQMSQAYFWTPLFIFIIWYVYIKLGSKNLVFFLLSCVLSIALTDLISVHLFKEVFERYRPTHNLEIGHLVKTVIKPNGEIYLGGKFGFVSSHAANYGGLTTLFILQLRKFSKWWMLLIVWFLVIVYTRIYLGVHYPSDIFMGGMIGIIIGFLVDHFFLKLIQRKYID